MKTSISLPLLLLSVWLLVTLLLAAAMYRQSRSIYTSVLMRAIAAWSVLDLRWNANSSAQAANTIQAYPLVTATYLNIVDDRQIRQLVDGARPDIESANSRTIIMVEDETMRFQMLRAEYHALPAAALVHEGPVKTVPANIGDYVLVLSKRYMLNKRHPDPEYKPAMAAEYAEEIDKRDGLQVTPLWDKREGFLVKIDRQSKPREPGE